MVFQTEHSTLRAPRMVQKLAKTKPNKNYSDSRDIFGDAKISATEVCTRAASLAVLPV